MQEYYGVFVALAISLIYSAVAWKLSYEQFSLLKFLRSVGATFAMSLGLVATGFGDVYINATIAPIVGLFLSKAMNYVQPVSVQTKYKLDELLAILKPVMTVVEAEAIKQATQVERPPEATEQ